MSPTTPQLPATVRTFTQLLSSTRRGEAPRLARLLTTGELSAWNVPEDVAERAEKIVAELAANAVFQGRVHGRDFRLGLTLDASASTLRIEVTDARGDRFPGARPDAVPDAETWRGLVLLAALADRWGSKPYPPSGKTVWSEVDTCPR
ncbi:Histidine kinase-like ATPase domain-containing protein [Streptomyces sp. WMMB 714]|uniref:ATP-binding protein n=1 Tax=Streptomyces sp. WMMB 714 TaxID=1286822 RepID=UPI0005F7773A|nr:ATP-binding protein [Streptomyces sp. WMMB 714]SCK47846.1 Histidine kinase-like ATPase domain-containing protein [Streptomyces sp. WMMB 714]